MTAKTSPTSQNHSIDEQPKFVVETIIEPADHDQLIQDVKDTSKISSSYRPDVDGLRTLAVLPVVIFHAYPDAFPGGFIGVDIFFVISGYLISGILYKEFSKGTFTYAGFYSRRVRRIFPTLILVLSSTLWLGYLYLMAAKLKALAATMLAGTLFCANLQVLSLEHTYFDIDIKTNPLLHLWSLGVEEQFYIFWPFLASIVMKLSYQQALKVQVGVLITSFLINVCFLGYHDNNKMSFYMPLSRFWQMSMGGLLAYVSKYATTQSYEGVAPKEDGVITPHWSTTLVTSFNDYHEHLLSIGGLVMILIGFACIDEERMFPGFWAILPTVGATMLIAAGSGGVVNQYVLSHPVAIYIGKISYCLYLWHWPLLVFAKERYPNVESRPFFMAPYVMLLVSFVLSVLTYEDVEKRLRRRKSKVLTPLLVFGVVVLAIFALCVYIRPESYSSIELELAQSSFEEESLDFGSPDMMNSESSSSEILTSGDVTLNSTWTMVKTETPAITATETPIADHATEAPASAVVKSTGAVTSNTKEANHNTVVSNASIAFAKPTEAIAVTKPVIQSTLAPSVNTEPPVAPTIASNNINQAAPTQMSSVNFGSETKSLSSNHGITQAPAAPVVTKQIIKKQHAKTTVAMARKSSKDENWDKGVGKDCPANSPYMESITLNPPFPYRGDRAIPKFTKEQCVILNPNQEKNGLIMVVGDSHADMTKPRFVKLYEDAVKVGQPYPTVVFKTRRGRAMLPCRPEYHEIFEIIKKTKPQAVLFSVHYIQYLHPGAPENRPYVAPPQCCQVEFVKCQEQNMDDIRELMKQYQNDLSELGALGIKVFVVDQGPETPGQDPTNWVNGDKVTIPKRVSRSAWGKIYKWMYDPLHAAVTGANATLIDFVDDYSDGDEVFMTHPDGWPVMSFYNHLSYYTSRNYMKTIDKVVKAGQLP
ncbi:acyltransferase 3 [Thraustotheca clavata]|uniref:Acyltransferase 3 n=1 Tax=Thraustotheca clavata TaxID=74557 RepID=A0A1V9YJL7_9STRA|nr:acyltransferase 3 [Thraustotheca clavata]